MGPRAFARNTRPSPCGRLRDPRQLRPLPRRRTLRPGSSRAWARGRLEHGLSVRARPGTHRGWPGRIGTRPAQPPRRCRDRRRVPGQPEDRADRCPRGGGPRFRRRRQHGHAHGLGPDAPAPGARCSFRRRGGAGRGHPRDARRSATGTVPRARACVLRRALPLYRGVRPHPRDASGRRLTRRRPAGWLLARSAAGPPSPSRRSAERRRCSAPSPWPCSRA